MRTLPRIMAERPNAQVVIVGGDGISYGLPPPQGTNWKSVFLKEVEPLIDTTRLHFVGHLPYEEYLKVLQISSAHVYLTYPFVLSWSFLEAMSAGCLVIGSDTAPVREVIEDGANGFLVPFFDVDAIADRVIEALANPSKFRDLRVRARQHMAEKYDMERVCLPRMLSLMNAPATPPVGIPGVSAFWPGKKRTIADGRARSSAQARARTKAGSGDNKATESS
jgi:glycosyltransferase involved in cell wall biosynthesis